MTINRSLQGRTKIPQQMPAIGDLERVRCALPYRIGIGTSTVTRDSLDPAMTLQPGRDRAGLAAERQTEAALRVAQPRGATR